VKENFLQHLGNSNAPACLLQSSLIFATRVAIDERDLSKTSILALRQKIGTQAKEIAHKIDSAMARRSALKRTEFEPWGLTLNGRRERP